MLPTFAFCEWLPITNVTLKGCQPLRLLMFASYIRPALITCFFIGFNLQEAYALVLKWYSVLLIRAIIDYRMFCHSVLKREEG